MHADEGGMHADGKRMPCYPWFSLALWEGAVVRANEEHARGE
jgi:hypothetical protein